VSDREQVLAAAMFVVAGDPKGLSQTTQREPNYCAQLVREVIERALGQWPTAVEALRLANRRGRVRWATDYLDAAKQLNLTHNEAPRPGDVLYWAYQAGGLNYGHTGIFLGAVNGIPSVLENTNAKRGKSPLFPQSPVRVTALSEMGAPIAVAAVTRAALPVAEVIPPPKTEEIDIYVPGTDQLIAVGTAMRRNNGRLKAYVRMETLLKLDDLRAQ
jgi:hypothetical protein